MADNKELYNRVCYLNLEGKVFAYDLDAGSRFQIEFSTEFNLSQVSDTCTVKLYNANDETIELCRPKQNDKSKTYKAATLEAGYKGNYGIVSAGEIFDFKSSKNGVDRILELKIAGNVSKLIGFPANRTYSNQNTSYIIKDLLGMAGLQAGEIKPEKEFLYGSFVAGDLRQALTRLAKDSGSDLYITANQVYLQSHNAVKEGILLNYSSGLLQEPEKTETGYSVKCLFNYKINKGSQVIVQGKKNPIQLKVQKGKHEFNTSSNATTDFEGSVIK